MLASLPVMAWPVAAHAGPRHRACRRPVRVHGKVLCRRRHRTVHARQTTWAPPGTLPLSDAAAAAKVIHVAEVRPGNTAANDYVPSQGQLGRFWSSRTVYGQLVTAWNPLYRYVDGRDGLHRPSTDDLIQWVAHKWGIPEDWVRAEVAQESGWRQSTVGDRSTVAPGWYALYPPEAQVAPGGEVFESMGLGQVKWRPDGSIGAGTEPLRWLSSAFNLDYLTATVRYFYDGRCDWCGGGYGRGQQWNSIGAWFSPYPWGNSSAQRYVREVQAILAARPWTRPGF
jgi:hypothetical protein